MKKVTASWSGSYYIYAIKSTHADMVKIGFFIADLHDLRNRYITPYGRNMDVCVFELPNKALALAAEKTVHTALKKAGYHLESELFKPACMPLFLQVAAKLCSETVTVAESRNCQARKRALDERRDQRENDREAKRRQLSDERNVHLASVDTAVQAILSDREHPIHSDGHVNAGAFRTEIATRLGRSVRQSDLVAAMTEFGFQYKLKRLQGGPKRLFIGKACYKAPV